MWQLEETRNKHLARRRTGGGGRGEGREDGERSKGSLRRQRRNSDDEAEGGEVEGEV